jgi:hypothetical protein
MRGQRMVSLGILHSDLGRRLAPAWLKRLIKSAIPYAEFRSEQCRREAEQLFDGPIPPQSEYASPYPFTIGVFTDTGYGFARNVRACREMGVSYRVLDLSSANWVEMVRESGCDAFLATPSTLLGTQRQMFDERLRVLVEDMRCLLYPSYSELWLWESKRRMRDWLVAHGVPHPRTEVFYNRDEAIAFVSAADYPLVCKTDTSATSKGVSILRGRRSALRLVGQAFGRGLVPRSWDRRDRQRGYVLLQAYVPHEQEWRIVRIGDDFLCRRKHRVGDYASGSGEIEWAKPDSDMLDFVEKVTNLGQFRSMAVDFYAETGADGDRRFLVNELQCLIGAIVNEQKRNEHTGKWQRTDGGWGFTPGFFYQNACTNLRVAYVIKDLAGKRGLELSTPIEVLPT